MSDEKSLDVAKEGFTALFMLRVAEIRPGDSSTDGLVAFNFSGGGAEYFKPGDLFTATFNPLLDEGDR